MQDSSPSTRDQPQTHQGEPASGGCFNPMEHMMTQLINIQQQMMTNNQEREEQQIERQRAHMEDQMRYEIEKRSRDRTNDNGKGDGGDEVQMRKTAEVSGQDNSIEGQ